jgi:hypothetical protein
MKRAPAPSPWSAAHWLVRGVVRETLIYGLLVISPLIVSEYSAWAQFPPPPGAAPQGAAQPQGQAAAPQGTVQCNDFAKLTTEAQKRSTAVGEALKTKADRKQICVLMTNFVAAETTVVKFLVDNKVWCGVPDQVITVSKVNHEKSLKFRTQACSDDGPHPKAPSLSDAIKTPTVDTSKNIKTGHGTFDTLTGNPLGR